MGCLQSFAANYTVTTKTDLQNRMATVVPGDTVKVANGTYHNWGQISFTNNNGTASSAWIVLKAETPGGVIFTGSAYLHFKGTRLRVDGFTFANGNAGTNAVVSFRSSSSNISNYCRISNIKIDNFNTTDSSSENEWVGLYGTNNRVDHCTFINKYPARATVVVWFSSTSYPNPATSTYHRIDSNYFAGRGYLGSNGGETIRIGDSNGSRTNGFNTIEYNLFENCRQTEPEIISNKSNFNVYRYNTFKNCKGGLTLRHGRYCSVYGNFFLVTDAAVTDAYGIRAIDKGHLIFNNYIEAVNGNSSGGSSQLRAPINLFNGASTDTTNAAAASGYFPADSCIVAFNTIVNARGGGGIVLGGTTGGTIQPKGIVLANNLVKMTTGSALYRNSANTSLTYSSEGNIYQAPSGLGESTTGWQSATLTFGSRVDGILEAPSLVSDAAVNSATYASLLKNVDVKLRTRIGTFDVGCEELNGSGMVVNRPLDSSEVGAEPHAINPLPVQLFSFTGQQKNQEIILNWHVSKEDNLLRYEVETATPVSAFKNIRNIAATGAAHYTFEHADFAIGQTNFYRLKMVDNNGRFNFSQIVSIDTRSLGTFKIYPNPASTFIEINFENGTKPFEFRFLNRDGRMVKKIMSASANTKISVADMAPGFYFIQVFQNNEFIYKQPILIQHP